MNETRELLNETLERAVRFIESLPERRVAAARGASELEPALGGALPAKGLPSAEILARLDEIGVQGVVASAGPRYFRLRHRRHPSCVAGRELACRGAGPECIQRGELADWRRDRADRGSRFAVK